MSQENLNGKKTYVAGGAVTAFRRVKLDSSLNVVHAGVDEPGIGTAEQTVASGAQVAVRLWNHPGTRKMVAAGAITAGALVMGAASGKIDDATGGGPACGVALEAASGDGATIEVQVFPIQDSGSKLLFFASADSAAIGASSSAEAAFGTSYTGNAGDLKEGDVLDIEALVKFPTTHSTDTATVKLKVATEVIATSAATDVADNDVCHIKARVTVRAAGASGKLEASGSIAIGASGTGAEKAFRLAEASEDLSGAVAITLTNTFSVADVGNTAVLQSLSIVRHRK